MQNEAKKNALKSTFQYDYCNHIDDFGLLIIKEAPNREETLVVRLIKRKYHEKEDHQRFLDIYNANCNAMNVNGVSTFEGIYKNKFESKRFALKKMMRTAHPLFPMGYFEINLENGKEFTLDRNSYFGARFLATYFVLYSHFLTADELINNRAEAIVSEGCGIVNACNQYFSVIESKQLNAMNLYYNEEKEEIRRMTGEVTQYRNRLETLMSELHMIDANINVINELYYQAMIIDSKLNVINNFVGDLFLVSMNFTEPTSYYYPQETYTFQYDYGDFGNQCLIENS
jgi:hypothetical protein